MSTQLRAVDRRRGSERRPSADPSLDGRRVWVPVFAVVLALAASLVLPTLLRAREEAYRRELREVIVPARDLAEARKELIQRGSSARIGYVASRNPVLLARAESLTVEAAAISSEMADLVERTAPETRAAFERLAAAEAEVAAMRPEGEPTQEELYTLLPRVHAQQEAVLAAYDSIDAALVSEMVRRERRLDSLARLVWFIDGFLALLAIAAVLSVARLTRAEQRARAAAEAAVRSRDEVVSIVSHDLRNPLSTVSMSAAFLEEIVPEVEERTPERRQIRIIRRAAESMNRMIQDLLDISRIESGRLAVETAPVPVPALVEDASTMLRPVAERGGQQLVCAVPDGLPPVQVDRDRMLQILSNLIGNAAKFTPRGGTITLAVEAEDSRVWFHVSDTGAGIPAENLPHLFDRFWQASRSDRRGIGLGLPIVKGLVEAHGGEIRVRSTPGEGSTFSFCVRRAPG